jgi:hypothetical protein
MTNRVLERFPSILPRESDSIIYKYTDAHAAELEEIQKIIDDAITSSQVNNATGDDLDRIGAFYDQLGERRSRTDAEYRTFIKSIPDSFGGNGTIDGVKFAVASAVTDATKDDIEITEDFQNNTYDITITGGTSYNQATVEEIADLADPSGVELDTVSDTI